LQKIPHREGDLFEVRFKREVAGIQKLDSRIRIVALERLGACGDEVGIVPSPT
jgi:hypothetical protein